MWSSLGTGARRYAVRVAAVAALSALISPVRTIATAQSPDPARGSASSGHRSSDLDSIVEHAVAVNPALAAARHRVEAARARVGPAGARPDPMLLAGIENQPLGPEAPMTSASGTASSGPDPMTMRVIGVSQTFPYPGKLALRTIVAQRDADAATAASDTVRLGVIRDVRIAYYELAYLDASRRIVQENRAILADVIRTTEARYATGSGTAPDVLKTRLDITQLAQQANALDEDRRTQVAALNALLDRPSNTPVGSAAIPERVARAAVTDSATRIRFASAVFGAPAADSPLPSLATLQDAAIANSTMLREHEARIAAQTARVALAEKATKPDIDVSLQYGQRSGLTDMVSAVVSIPIPIQHRRKQDEDVAAARDELDALGAEHHAAVNELRMRVAKLYADAERSRTQLALDVKAILPQGHASLAAATARYQAGKTDLLTLLDSQSMLFAYETSYYRSLADFAEALAQLDAVVGKEVLP